MDFHGPLSLKYAEGEFPEIAREYDQKEEFPGHLWKKACRLGFVGVFIKEDYGGPGLGFFEHCLINEEFWRVDPGIGLSILAATFGSEMIQLFGTEEQKKALLPPLVKGEAITGAAIPEPDAGSDVTSVITRAIPVEGEYIINGTKTFTTNDTTASSSWKRIAKVLKQLPSRTSWELGRPKRRS